MRPTRPYWNVPRAALCVALLAGCREELGPVKYPTTRVTGQVREGGRPVAGGWIEFFPVDGTVGDLRSAPIAADGRFEASGVAVGRNAIDVVHAPIRWPEVRRLLSRQGKPIRRNLPPGTATTLTIDLLEEAIRLEKETNPETRR